MAGPATLDAILGKLDDDESGLQDPGEVLDAFADEFGEVRKRVQEIERHLILILAKLQLPDEKT
jgi:hypothetical protein